MGQVVGLENVVHHRLCQVRPAEWPQLPVRRHRIDARRELDADHPVVRGLRLKVARDRLPAGTPQRRDWLFVRGSHLRDSATLAAKATSATVPTMARRTAHT